MANARDIAFFPPIDTAEDLSGLLARIGWYLYPYRDRIRSVRLPVTAGAPGMTRVPHGFDPAGAPRLAAMLRKCEPLDVAGLDADAAFARAVDGAGVVLVWRWPDDPGARGALRQRLGQLPQGSRWYEVDADKTRSEGSFYLWLGSECFPDDGEALAASRAAFARYGETQTKRKAYVFGTGPSLADLGERSFADGDCLVSNSIVKNRALLRRLKPRGVVAADPIFHAGCSSYAGEFRRHLAEVMDEFIPFLFVPMRDFQIYQSFLAPRHHERLVGVPFDDSAPFNIDLQKRFHVNGTGNVLTLLLLPIAATHHDEIAVLGCDGRPLSENAYFWKHDPASQFGDQMETIQKVHPAFFAIDYNDYYQEHCSTLASAVGVIEAAGKTLEALTPSHIPALAQRQAAGVPAAAAPLPSSARLQSLEIPAAPDLEIPALPDLEVVSVAPDGLSAVGHYFSYEDFLYSVFQRVGIPYLTLCNRDITPEVLAERPFFRPALGVHSWDIGNDHGEPPVARVAQFRRELADGLDHLVRDRGNCERVLYLYYGSLYHAETMVGLLDERPWLRVVVNLFWSSYHDVWTDDFGMRWRDLLARAAGDPRVSLSVPTVEVGDDLFRRTGHRLPVAPHPSPTFDDEAYLRLVAFRPPMAPTASRHTVLFPGLMRHDKGYHTAVTAARLLCQDAGFDCVIRDMREQDTAAELVLLAQDLPERVRVLRGEVERERFVSMMTGADIAVIPYEVSAFARRTSGLLVDALYAGLPVVALRGSWLGNRVEELGGGITVDAADPVLVADAVRRIRDDLAGYRLRASRAGRMWFQANNWTAMAGVILNGG